jgi:hypothetical protein
MANSDEETPSRLAARKARSDERERRRRLRAQRREERRAQAAAAAAEAEAKAAMAKKIKDIIDPTSTAEANDRVQEQVQKAESHAKGMFDRRNVILREGLIQDKKILQERAKESIKRDLAAFFREAFLDGGKTKINTIILNKIRSK